MIENYLFKKDFLFLPIQNEIKILSRFALIEVQISFYFNKIINFQTIEQDLVFIDLFKKSAFLSFK